MTRHTLYRFLPCLVLGLALFVFIWLDVGTGISLGLCLGRRACARVDCKQRCRSWFPYEKSIKKGCQQMCMATDGRDPKTKEDYLGVAITDPNQLPGVAEQKSANVSNRKTAIIIGVSALVLFIIAVIIIRRRRG